MGVAFAGLQKYDEALKWYDKSLVLESDAGTLYNKGNSLMNLRHYEDAIRSYNKALQLKPNSISTLLNKSRAHWYLEDYKNVLDCLRKAEKLQPKNKRVTIFLTEYHNFKHEVELWRGQIWREQISS
jgi:tetratricopeptide (TPR) repeat protein